MTHRLRADILVEHAEEIEILGSRRRSALWSPRETLDTLAKLERRLDAHVEGLALDVDGEHACFARGLADGDPDAAFAIALTLLRQRTHSSLARLADAYARGPAGVRRGIAEAVAYEAPAQAPWLAHDAPPAPAVPETFALGCRGDDTAIAELRRRIAHEGPGEELVRALGSTGLAAAVPELLALMRSERIAPAAGEAFRRITGLDVVARPESPEPDDDATFEETRPWPDAGATAALWRRHEADFAGHARWRYGRPLDSARWLTEPHAGDLLTRREEITRLRLADASRFANLDLDAPAARQRNWAPTRGGQA